MREVEPDKLAIETHDRKLPGEENHRRCQVEHELGKADRPVVHRGEVAQALRDGQTTRRERVHVSDDLQVAFGPAEPLRAVAGKIHWRQAGDEELIQIDRFPPGRLKRERRVHVLGDRAGELAPERLECLAAQHGAGAAEEGGVPVILARHHQVEEDVLLPVQPPHPPADAVLERIEVVVPLRRLHERHPRIIEEPERALQKIGARHVVGIEGGNQGTGRCGERVVPVAGLGMFVGVTGEVVAPEFLAQRLDVGPAAVVEHERAMRIAHVDRRAHGLTQQVDLFVEGGDEDIDGRRRRRRSHGAAAHRPDLKVVKGEREEPVDLSEVDSQREDEGFRVERVEAAIPEIHGVDEQRRHGRGLPERPAPRRVQMRQRGIRIERSRLGLGDGHNSSFAPTTARFGPGRNGAQLHASPP